MVSGADLPQAREETKNLENIGYLNKPFRVDNLLPALKGEYTE